MPNSLNALLILVVDWCTWHLICTLSHKRTWWIVATIIPNLQKPKSWQLALVSKNLFVPKAVKFFWAIPEIYLTKNMLWWPDIFGHQNQKGKTCSPRLKDVFEAFVKKWKSLTWHARSWPFGKEPGKRVWQGEPKLGRWMDKPSIYYIEADQLDFLLVC